MTLTPKPYTLLAKKREIRAREGERHTHKKETMVSSIPARAPPGLTPLTPLRGRPAAKRVRLEGLLLPRLAANLLEQIPRCPQHVVVRGVLSALVRWRIAADASQLRRLDAKAAGWLTLRPTEGGLARLAYVVKDFVELGHRPDDTLAVVGDQLAGPHGAALLAQQVGTVPRVVHAKLLLEAAAPSSWGALPPPPPLPPTAIVRLACTVAGGGSLPPIRALYALSRIGELAAAIQRPGEGAGAGAGLDKDSAGDEDGAGGERAAAGCTRGAPSEPDPALAAAFQAVVDGVAGRLDPLIGAALASLSERSSRWDRHSDAASAEYARAKRLYYLTRALARLRYAPRAEHAAAFAAAAAPLAPLMSHYFALAVLHRLHRWHQGALLPGDAAPALAPVVARVVELGAEEVAGMRPAMRAWMMEQLREGERDDIFESSMPGVASS